MTDLAWHFTGDTLRDGSPIPPIGHTLRMDGKIVICERGYHWSRTPWQALQYAPGPIIHRVRVSGTVIEQPDDKGVSRERTILASMDVTPILRRFAADQALSVADKWDMPDVVREYLTTLDESKRDAAWDAARAAAWDAASAAAIAAARAAAWAAARDAVRAVAWDAARAAARAVAASDFNARIEAAIVARITPED